MCDLTNLHSFRGVGCRFRLQGKNIPQLSQQRRQVNVSVLNFKQAYALNESRPGNVKSCSSVSGCEGTKTTGGAFNDDTHSFGGKMHGPARLNVSDVSIA